MKKSYYTNPGFSLIELIIVVALFTIVCMITVGNLSFLDRLLVRAQAEKLFLTCRMLQQQAMSNNSDANLAFDVQNQCYRYNNITEQLPETVYFGVIPGIKGPPSKPERNLSKPITYPKQQITFHPDGIISPGSAYVISKDMQIMYAISCPVSQVSFLRLYRYNKKWESLL